ncbi:hypothetical protein HPB48_024039 [Haemaphysalis longicornis]|uniref:Elongation of very long chain fatty acids protein n=1 Tax=Haemaphysalis longicornis TaxID=44386 RepID=A0A9J6H7F9_HAELO|nr:hypothetical protein HPB48_024039 [Haemaphysalis longicornis]
MKGRQPYERIKPIIALYNASQVILNGYFMMAFLNKTFLRGHYSFICQPMDFEARDENTRSLLNHCWWYFLVRVADFLDTVFFVLRKKQSHVSFLHVAHHIIVVFNGWYGLAFGSDGHAIFPCDLQQFCARDHVLLLLSCPAGPLRSEISLVEAIFNSVSVNSICRPYHSLLTRAVHSLRLPAYAHFHRSTSGILLPRHVYELLYQCVQ